MADADDKLDFCKQALGELGTRSTITSLDPPDGSQEAFYCNLFFDGTRDQILRAAHWGFAGRSDVGRLWKALPGTPENPTIPPNYQWSNRDPAPPWLYSYEYPATGVVQVRRIRGQSNITTSGFVPFYGGSLSGFSNQSECMPFEVSSDVYDRDGRYLAISNTITSANTFLSPGTGYRPADYMIMVGAGGLITGQPATLQVLNTDAAGAVVAVAVANGGSFTGGPATVQQESTTGVGTGFSCAPVLGVHAGVQKVILANVNNALLDFTVSVDVSQYDPLFADAFMLALEGKLALALIGDRAMYQAKLQEANNSIINARVRDGNEGLTTYDHVPDWLTVRGVSSMASAREWFNPPYGPLFAV